MMYLEHRKRYVEYCQAQDDLNRILDEWVLAFQLTQPKSFTYGDKVQTSHTGNSVEEYVITVENRKIYERLYVAREVMRTKKELLDLKEEELRKSKDIYDLIYTAQYVDHLKTREIYKRLDFIGMSYSTSQIYEIRRRIKAQIERISDAE